MTRKEELEERATRFLKENGQYDENGDIYLCDVEELLGVLLQVEREVLGRVKKAVVQKRAAIHPEHTQEFKSGAGNVLYDLEQWLETQQQEQT